MSKPTVTELLALPLAERIQLAQALWDSISEVPDELPLSDADRAELDRRLEAYYRDPNAGSPWQEVVARIRQRAKG